MEACFKTDQIPEPGPLDLILASGVRANPHASIRGATGRSRSAACFMRTVVHQSLVGETGMFRVTTFDFDLQAPGFSGRTARVCGGQIGSPLDHGMVSCYLDGCDPNLHNTQSAEAVTLIYSR